MSAILDQWVGESTRTYVIPLFGVLVAIMLGRMVREWRRAPLPPGPRGLPFVGNVRDWPEIGDQPKVFAEWAKKYGPVVHVCVMGQPFVLLNTWTAAHDLMTRRSENYSDRHCNTLIHDDKLSGYGGWHLPMMPYGAKWRVFRKHFHSLFRIQEVEPMRPAILDLSSEFLHHLRNTPRDFRQLIRSYTAKSISKFVFSHDQPLNTVDPYLTLNDELMEEFNGYFFGNVFLVDVFPFLKHIPASWPGAGFKRFAIQHKKKVQDLIDGLHNRLQVAIANGTAEPCMVTRSMEKAAQATGVVSAAEEQLIKCNAMLSYAAGTDTSASVLANFFLCMSLYPEVQKKAQEEVDRVTGGTRLPDFEDRAALTYISAVLLESIRWHAPGPVSIPHKSVKEDIYMGYRIPAGSVILGNVAEITHSTDFYENPSEYNPARFLDENWQIIPELEVPIQDAFGFGRRVCPGRHLALESMWILMARIIATHNIGKELDAQGNEIEPVIKFTGGVTTHPEPYQCHITARGKIQVD